MPPINRLPPIFVPPDATVLGVRPETFGALGNNSHDDTAAIQEAIATAGIGGTVQFTPDKIYKITDTLRVTLDRQTWLMRGAKVVRYGNGIGVQVGIPNPSPAKEKVWDFYAEGGQVFRESMNYTSGNVGVQFLNTNNCSWYDFHVEGFETGFELLGDGGTGNRFIGCQYSNLRPWWLVNNRRPIVIRATRNGWSNQSQWWGGGRVGYYSERLDSNVDDASGAYALTLDTDAGNGEVINAHNFYGVTFEDAFTAAHAKKPTAAFYLNCQDCNWYGGRVEGFTSPKVICTGSDFSGCSFEDVQSLLLPSQDFLFPSSAKNIFIRVNRAMYFCGGTPSDAAFTLREKNDVSKPVFQIQHLDGTPAIEMRSQGGIRQKVNNSTWAHWDSALWIGQKQWQPTETGQTPGTIRANKYAITTVTISSGVARKGDPVGVGFRGDLGLGTNKDDQCLIWSAQVANDLGLGFNTVRVIAYNPGPLDITGMASDTLTVHARQGALT